MTGTTLNIGVYTGEGKAAHLVVPVITERPFRLSEEWWLDPIPCACGHPRRLHGNGSRSCDVHWPEKCPCRSFAPKRDRASGAVRVRERGASLAQQVGGEGPRERWL